MPQQMPCQLARRKANKHLALLAPPVLCNALPLRSGEGFTAMHCNGNERGGGRARAFLPSFHLEITPRQQKGRGTDYSAPACNALPRYGALSLALMVTTPSDVTVAVPFVCGPTRVTLIVP